MPIREQVEELRRTYPKVNIQSATKDFLTASYQRTPTSCIKLTLTFAGDDHHIVVDVHSSPVVPPGLKKKLERELSQRASEKDAPILAIFSHLTHFIDTNRFVPCWKELRKAIDLVKPPSTVSICDRTGVIQLRLSRGQYFYACSITIHKDYPTTTDPREWGQACRLKLKKTNFPSRIERMLTTQAQEVVRRMQDGKSPELALQMSNPIKLHDMTTPKNSDQVRLTQTVLKGLKRDTETLKRVHDLRAIDTATRQGNATIKANTAKERKDARRQIGKIAEWELKEQERMEAFDMPDYKEPQPSLLVLVQFLKDKIQHLPEETCPICKELVLPKDPQQLDSLVSKKQKRRPIRTYCGCWYHYGCLNTFMTEPPFGAACPNDNTRVFHPDWPSDMRELERMWAMKQAREREIADAAMCF